MLRGKKVLAAGGKKKEYFEQGSSERWSEQCVKPLTGSSQLWGEMTGFEKSRIPRESPEPRNPRNMGNSSCREKLSILYLSGQTRGVTEEYLKELEHWRTLGKRALERFRF